MRAWVCLYAAVRPRATVLPSLRQVASVEDPDLDQPPLHRVVPPLEGGLEGLVLACGAMGLTVHPRCCVRRVRVVETIRSPPLSRSPQWSSFGYLYRLSATCDGKAPTLTLSSYSSKLNRSVKVLDLV